MIPRGTPWLPSCHPSFPWLCLPCLVLVSATSGLAGVGACAHVGETRRPDCDIPGVSTCCHPLPVS